MEINMELFNTFNWIMTSRDDKIKALQELENFFAEQQKRPPCAVKAVAMDDIRKKGLYKNDTKTIEINENILANDYMNRFDVIDTIIHEGRHAYQHFAVENPGVEQNQKLVKKWNENFVFYNEPNDPEQYLYRFQAVERDAFNYSEGEMDKHFKNMAGEKELYIAYTKGLHGEKNIIEKQAQRAFGRNYENVIDGIVELAYIGKSVPKDNTGEKRVIERENTFTFNSNLLPKQIETKGLRYVQSLAQEMQDTKDIAYLERQSFNFDDEFGYLDNIILQIGNRSYETE